MIIHVGNSYSRIEGMSPKFETLLRKELSYTTGSMFSGFGFKRKTLLDKQGRFPTGLLDRVISFVYARPEGDTECITITSTRKRPTELHITSPAMKVVPYMAQTDAVNAAIEQLRGIIAMPTGTGKSVVIGLIASRLRVKTLVIVPTLEIKKQLSDVLKGHINVTVMNIDSPKLKNMTDFDCLIIDEAHHVAAKTYQKLNKTAWTGVYYRFFMTATPFRNDKEEDLLFESIAGKIIYKLDYHEAIKNNYIVPVESYYLDVPKQDTDAYSYMEVYKQLVVRNKIRNNIIANLITNLHSTQKSTLCLVKEVAHGKILSELTGIPFASGEDDDSRKWIQRFNSKQISVLIGTTGLLGEGIDTKPCEYVILAGLGKARSNLMQQIGRGVRRFEGKESCKVVLFKDTSHKFLLRHFRIQSKLLEVEYGAKPVRLE